MTYRAGISPTLALTMGWDACEPHIVCDGCGAVRGIGTKTSWVAQWFLNNRPAPGWSLERTEHEDGRVTRVDLCPRCMVMA